MRLAIVETAPRGGLLHYAVQFGEALAARGHEVDLLTPRGHELAGRRGPARMRAVLTPPTRSDADPERPMGRLRRLARRAAIALRLVRAWARILWEVRRGGYDAVVVNCDIALSPAAAAALLLTSLPGGPRLAQVCHNVRPFNRWAGRGLFVSSPLVMKLLRLLLPRYDLLFVHGERSRAEFEATWPPARLAVIPHGDERLFADEPPPPSGEERILFFGDWRKVKGLSTLMDAFDELASRRMAVRLTIAGAAAPQDWDPDIVRRWAAGHGERVKLIDRYVPVADVRALFGEARVVATPYLVGYQSGVVQLAMTMARPVVASDVGDFGASVIDGLTGRLVPPGDAHALAAALEDVLADPGRAARLGEQGRRRVLDASSWERVAERAESELSALDGATRG